MIRFMYIKEEIIHLNVSWFSLGHLTLQIFEFIQTNVLLMFKKKTKLIMERPVVAITNMKASLLLSAWVFLVVQTYGRTLGRVNLRFCHYKLKFVFSKNLCDVIFLKKNSDKVSLCRLSCPGSLLCRPGSSWTHRIHPPLIPKC